MGGMGSMGLWKCDTIRLRQWECQIRTLAWIISETIRDHGRHGKHGTVRVWHHETETIGMSDHDIGMNHKWGHLRPWEAWNCESVTLWDWDNKNVRSWHWHESQVRLFETMGSMGLRECDMRLRQSEFIRDWEKVSSLETSGLWDCDTMRLRQWECQLMRLWRQEAIES